MTPMSQFKNASNFYFSPKSSALIFCSWSSWIAWSKLSFKFLIWKDLSLFLHMRVLYSFNNIRDQNLACTVCWFNTVCMFCHVTKYSCIGKSSCLSWVKPPHSENLSCSWAFMGNQLMPLENSSLMYLCKVPFEVARATCGQPQNIIKQCAKFFRIFTIR